MKAEAPAETNAPLHASRGTIFVARLERPKRSSGKKATAHFASSFSIEDEFAAQVRLFDLGVLDGINLTGEDVAIQHDQVGQLPGFEGTEAVFLEEQVRVVDRVKADGLLAGESLFGMELAVVPPGAPRDGCLH